MRTTTRTTVLAAAAAGAVAAARAVGRRREQLAAVAPDLRHGMLWAPLVVSARTLPLVRRAMSAAPPSSATDPVRRTAPGLDGRPDVEVWLHEPASRSSPSGAVLWIHGGGYVMGSPVTDHPLCESLAEKLGVLVVAVDYRLAPEHPAPAALEDCHTALRWVHANADELGVAPDRVAVAGQSAGGGLAAALAQLAHDRDDAPLAFQALLYPMLDDRTALDHDPATGHFVWTPGSNRFGWTSYLGHPAGTGDPVPHSVPARREDLRGLPPAWIGVGDLDLFRDEDLAYARRLADAGVPCAVHVVPGMYHAADVVRPGAPAMAAFRESWTEALRSAVTGA